MSLFVPSVLFWRSRRNEMSKKNPLPSLNDPNPECILPKTGREVKQTFYLSSERKNLGTKWKYVKFEQLSSSIRSKKLERT